MSRSDLALLYRRAGFGLTGAELDQLAATSYGTAVETLLSALSAPDSVAPPTFTPFTKPTPGDQTARRAIASEVAALQSWWVQRMITTSTPLQEKLTLFWHGHFATGVSKVREAKLMYLQNHLFRTAGGGSFETLTQAVAKDGAMMIWLDTATDVKAHPNENFAREMMELFTLGIGNYSQDDVTAAARAFTGWAYDRTAYQYVFRPRQHDYTSKTFLGQTGAWNGGSSLDATAALRALFNHPAFLSTATRTGLVKQPLEYLAGAARALGLSASVAKPELATQLGQTPFDPPNVGGWGQNGYWLDTATAEIRLRTARYLASQADLTQVASISPGGRVDYVAWMLGLDGWGPTTASALGQVSSSPVDLVALSLCSPEYVVA